jgi:hypothetical protein
MASFDDIYVKGQFFNVKDPVGPEILGRGPLKIRGSSYIQGPALVGNHAIFPNVWASCMVSPLTNSESPPPFIPGVLQAGCTPINNSPYSLAVIGDAAIFDNLDVNLNVSAGLLVRSGGLIISSGDVLGFCGADRLSAKKNFDIPHPTKEGWRLRHTCPEAPYNDVYVRGRITNKTAIQLPEYWKTFVDTQSITVSLTPVGAHQDVIVKRIEKTKIHLQAKGGMPIDCFYHVYGTRTDGEDLISEYEGLTPNDYPGDNSEYNINI